MTAGKVTVSVGVATFPHDAGGKEQLVWAADNCLYMAKEFGRNKVVLAEGVYRGKPKE